MNQHRIQSARVAAVSHIDTRFTYLNTALVVIALSFLVYYVVQVNFVASHAWTLGDANDRLTALRDQKNALVAQEASLDDRESLAVLAQQQGLVPAGSVVYLVQDHAVATAQ